MQHSRTMAHSGLNIVYSLRWIVQGSERYPEHGKKKTCFYSKLFERIRGPQWLHNSDLYFRVKSLSMNCWTAGPFLTSDF